MARGCWTIFGGEVIAKCFHKVYTFVAAWVIAECNCECQVIFSNVEDENLPHRVIRRKIQLQYGRKAWQLLEKQ